MRYFSSNLNFVKPEIDQTDRLEIMGRGRYLLEYLSAGF